MMTHAYSEIYLKDAINNFAEAIDYAVNACNIDIDKFVEMFIFTGYASEFENGNPRIIVGMSGTELVMEVCRAYPYKINFPPAQVEYDFSKEYWAGWILAYYQWYSNKSFKRIFDRISIKEIAGRYNPLHEAPEEKSFEYIDNLIASRRNTTYLQERRLEYGLSQKELSLKSGVNIRTIQQYEIKAKDINKASVSTVLALSKILHCKIEDLLE